MNIKQNTGSSITKILCMGSVSVISMCVSTGAIAQEQGYELDEIVVSATKTGKTSLQDTAIAISAFGGNDLVSQGISDVNDLQALVPALNIENNSSGVQVFLRGVGTNLVFAANDPSVTINLDGVYIGRPFGSIFDFADVEQVEILRGPQGTLWGRNAIGGAINISTKAPSDEFDYTVVAEAGNFGRVMGSAWISGPVIEDVLSVGVSLRHFEHNGYIENIVPGGTDIQSAERDSARISAVFTPNDRFKATVRADYTKVQDNWGTYSVLLEPASTVLGNVFGLTTPLADSVVGDYSKAAANNENDVDSELWGASLDLEYEVSDAVSLTSLTALRKTDHLIAIDFDATEAEIGNTSPLTTTAEQWTQEFNLVYSSDNITGIIGAFYIHEDANEVFNIQLLGDNVLAEDPLLGGGVGLLFDTDVVTKSIAIFAQGTYDFSEKLSLTLGMRYTDDTKDIAGSGIVGGGAFSYSDTFKDSAFTPKIGLEYRPLDNLLVFGSVSNGYKSGGFATTTTSSDRYSSESLWAYEVGFKSDMLDNRLRLNGTAFYYDYSDLQVQRVVNTSLDVDNADKSRVYGAELEVTYSPVESLELGFSATYLDAKYSDFTDSVDDATGLQFDASGQQLSNAPRLSMVASAQYTHELSSGNEINARVDGNYQSRIYFTTNNEPLLSQKPYGLVNLSLGYRLQDENLEIQAFVKNAFNKQYVTGAERFIAAGLPAQGFPGEPRVFGLRVIIGR
ncbi:MAG: TonB-dependent receptor [Emcibacter sp.]|nr:TonB-dependent receptor [Emcibacter sp.]